MLSSKPTREQALEAVRTLLGYIGEDPSRQGLIGTPERVVAAWEKDWGAGYQDKFFEEQKASIFKGSFEGEVADYDQMIVLPGIKFYSHCEHHMALFFGTVTVAYIPNGKILGLSKFGRITNLVTQKLQVQERITTEIANLISGFTDSRDVGVVVRAQHMCMCSRGVRQDGSYTITSALRGEFQDSPSTRSEFLRLAQYSTLIP